MWHKGFLDAGNFYHHALGVIAYILTGYYQHNYNALSFHLLAAEFSNAAMHGREIIRRMGMRYTKTYYLNDYCYYSEYFLCRFFWIPSIYFFSIYPCATMHPIQTYILYPIHLGMSFFYASHTPGLMRQRYQEIQ